MKEIMDRLPREVFGQIAVEMKGLMFSKVRREKEWICAFFLLPAIVSEYRRKPCVALLALLRRLQVTGHCRSCAAESLAEHVARIPGPQ